jgi:hypothetical protein
MKEYKNYINIIKIGSKVKTPKTKSVGKVLGDCVYVEYCLKYNRDYLYVVDILFRNI